jgi:hypothetical protein
MAKTSGGKPPPSTDLEGWRQAIANGRLTTFRLEHIAAAFQDLGPADRRVYDALTRHLSGAIMGMLLKRVDQNRPNWGKDIVDEVHDEIFAALLQPNSADGKALSVAFGPRVLFRMKTAIANALRDQVSPVPKPMRRHKADDVEESLDEVEDAVDEATKVLGGGETNKETSESAETDKAGKMEKEDTSPPIFAVDEAEDDEIGPGKREYDPTLLDGVRELDETIDVERVLSAIPDYKKQLAFRLYMDDVPFKSDRGNSIAKACGVSEKTARKWIKEIEAELQQNKEAQELLKIKVGAKS